ncbi:tellurium resistance protein TerC, partial [Blastococcus sp. TBT05-19]
RATRGQGRKAFQAPVTPPFRVATDEEIAALQPVWGRASQRQAPGDTEREPDARRRR